MKLTKSILLSMLLVMGLSACDTMGSMNPFREEKAEPCPRIRVLKNAADLTKFQPGPGRDLIDVSYEAAMTNAFTACEYDVDYETRAGTITAQVAPVIAAQRGPANQDGFADLEYFVAIVDKDQKIRDKHTLPIRIAFPGNKTQNEVRDDPVTLTIVTDGSKDGSDFEIYLGLQLTREEIEYNKRQAAR